MYFYKDSIELICLFPTFQYRPVLTVLRCVAYADLHLALCFGEQLFMPASHPYAAGKVCKLQETSKRDIILRVRALKKQMERESEMEKEGERFFSGRLPRKVQNLLEKGGKNNIS